MLQKKWVKALLVLIGIWLIITIYFYNQHRVTIKRCVIDQTIKYEDFIIKFDELVLIKFENNYSHFDDWRWDVVVKLPRFLQRPFLSISRFYSKPYKELKYNKDNQFGNLELRGTIIGEYSDGKNFHNIISNNIALIDEKGSDFLNTESSFEFSNTRNINYFCKYEKYFDQKIKNLEAVIKDDNNNTVASFPINIKWQTEKYNYFNGNPQQKFYQEPQNIVKDFLQRKNNNKDYLDLFYLQGQNINWKNLEHDYWGKDIYFNSVEYLENYKDWEAVYLSKLVFQENEELVASQKIYLIDTGKLYKIVEISPLIIEEK